MPTDMLGFFQRVLAWPWLLTWGHKDESQDEPPCQEESTGLGDVSAQMVYGEDGDELGGDVDPTKDELEDIEVHSKFFHTHGQAVVAKTSGKPEGRGVIDWHLQPDWGLSPNWSLGHRDDDPIVSFLIPTAANR